MKKTLETNKSLSASPYPIIILLLLLLYSHGAYNQTFTAPPIDWRRSDWSFVRPNDGVQLNQHTAGEDWWYGHCNAYNGNEFVGYMCVGFGRPILNFPSTDECFNPSQNIPSQYVDCDGQAFHAIGLIDKSGNDVLMYKLIKNSYEELFNVTQTSDGNFVAVGFQPGTKDVNDHGLIYNPRINGNNISFYGTNDCLQSINGEHCYVIKFDINGNIIWQYLYGMYDPIDMSIEEIRKAHYSTSIAHDLVETDGGRIRIIGTETSRYLNSSPTYKDPNFYQHGFIIDIDQNGYLLDRHDLTDNSRYGNVIRGSYLYAIDKLPSISGEDRFVVSGHIAYGYNSNTNAFPFYQGDECFGQFIGSYPFNQTFNQTNKSFADVYSYNGTDYTTDWSNPFTFIGGILERRMTKSYDVKTLTDGRICMGSLAYQNGCGFSGVNKARGYFHILNPNTGLQENLALVPDLLAAFDLKLGIAKLPNGEFGIVSSTQQTPPFSTLTNSDVCYSEGRGYNAQITNTDAYVARFNSQGELLWKTYFNVDDNDEVISTPENPKQQECLYSISVCPTDQSFVIAGNNSYNMDDSYLVKLKSDCSSMVNYDINGNETSPYVVVNETWNTSKKIRGPVLVSNGGTLSIEGANTVIEFADYNDREADGTRIEIEPGGKLIVNGARLTSLLNCPSSTWRGIIVRGDANENQYSTVNGVSHQGKFIGNNCTIENAEEAIEVVNSNGWQSGGIVQARNCLFKNNERCVSFQSYRNLTPAGNETSNFSYFEKCHFLIDQPLIKGNDPRGIVTLWAVKGIQFRGCKWENTNPQATTAASLGFNGIFGIDADFCVGSYCDQLLQVNQPCDPAYYTRSEFINMNAGIRSQKTSGLTRFTVGETDFKNCVYGVYNEGHDYIVASNNKFTQGNNILSPFFDIGILNITGTKYSIEQNVFSSPSQSLTEFSIGTTIFNSGMLTNEVYKNDFSSLSIANLALGNNRNNNPTSNQQFSGLEYRCNLMSNNDFDIAVIGFDKFGGINMYQGGIASGNKIDAGNTFSQNGNPETDIYNWSDNPILYVYNPTIAEQEPIYRSQSVSNIAFQGPYNLCLPKRGGKVTKMVKLTSAEHISLSNSATSSLAELSTLKNYYSLEEVRKLD